MELEARADREQQIRRRAAEDFVEEDLTEEGGDGEEGEEGEERDS